MSMHSLRFKFYPLLTLNFRLSFEVCSLFVTNDLICKASESDASIKPCGQRFNTFFFSAISRSLNVYSTTKNTINKLCEIRQAIIISFRKLSLFVCVWESL